MDCGCEDHLERTLYDSVLPFTFEGTIEKLCGRESLVVEEFMRRQKYTHASLGQWTDEALSEGSTRMATFRVPNPLLKGRDTLTCETWTVARHTPDILVIDKTARTPEAMYGDCFEVRVRYCLTRHRDGCRMVTSAGMHWIKGTIMKGIIRATATRITDQAVAQMSRILRGWRRREEEGEGVRAGEGSKGWRSRGGNAVSVGEVLGGRLWGVGCWNGIGCHLVVNYVWILGGPR